MTMDQQTLERHGLKPDEYERIVGFRPVVLSGAQAQTIVDSVLNLTQANPDALGLLRRLAQETE